MHTVKKPQFGYGLVSTPTNVPVSSSSSPLSSAGPSFAPIVPQTEQFNAFGISTTESIAEDWGKYSSSTVSTSNPLEGVHFPAVDSSEQIDDDWGDFSATTATAGVEAPEEESWCNFNSEAEDAVSREPDSNFVTIKKQNLGTSEILGLFKVRDDPTTLSSYQLPQQQLQPTVKSRWDIRLYCVI